jgi:hypothetical protein
VVELPLFYLCPRCFSAADAPGPCPRCGAPRARCALGALDDPLRRPLMDDAGRVLCRAPRWWLDHTAPYLRRAPSPRPPGRI